MASVPRSWILFVLVLVAPARQAGAQLGCSGATCTVEISMPVTDVLRLSLSAPNIALGSPDDVDYQAGYRDVAGTAVNVTVRANRSFVVQLGGVTGSFSYAGSLTDPVKPASDLRWATSAAGLASTTNHMGTSATLLASPAAFLTQPLFLRTLWSFATDVPGTYALTISFTLSAP
jgi:hypothetical protein